MNIIREKLFRRTKRIVIKIGSGVVTDNHGLDQPFFIKLALTVKKLRSQGIQTVIVSSGAIACGMAKLRLKVRPAKIPQKQAVAAFGQPLLMQHYIEFFGKQKLRVSQMLLTKADLEDKGRFENARHAVNELFRMEVVPVVNENDSVAVEEIKFGDNDQLSARVAHLVKADLLIILTDVDGFYDGHPQKNKSVRRISFVEKIDAETFKAAGDTYSAKSTGGMTTKLKAAQIAGSYGIPTLVANGEDPQIIISALKGADVGTLFLK